MKRLIYLLFLLALVPFFVGSQTKVSQLPYAAALTGTEAVPIVQSGQTVQASVSQFNAYSQGTLPFTVNGNNQIIFPTTYAPSGYPQVTLYGSIGSDALAINAVNANTRSNIVFFNTGGAASYIGVDGGQQILSDSSNGDLVFRSATGNSIRFGSLANSNQTMLRIGPQGNVVISPPNVSTNFALNVNGATGAYAEYIAGGNGATGSGLLIQGGYTGAGNVGLLSLVDANNTNGVNLYMNGNGGGQSCKTLRVYLGHFNITNCAYTQTLLDLDDNGSLQIGSTNQGQGVGTVVVGNGYWNNLAPLPGSVSTVFSVSGCGAAGSKTGTTVNGSFTVGTGASPCTFTFTFPTSPLGHGWNCVVGDATNNTTLAPTTGGSATTCLVKGNAATSDLILLQSAFPF